MKRFFKIQIVLFTLMFVLSNNILKAQGWEAAGSALVTYGVKEGVKHLHPAKVKWILTGMKHTWWYAKYEDGTVSYNNFRSYRSGQNVLDYFTGNSKGDCNSHGYDYYDRKITMCYRGKAEAESHVRNHGKIVDIGFQNKNRRWVSVLSF